MIIENSLSKEEKKLYQNIEKILEKIPIKAKVGCTIEKAFDIANLIYENNIKISIEIGVYYGRSLFPQAYAHKNYTNGKVYGIDPWSYKEAMQFDLKFNKSNLPENILKKLLNGYLLATNFKETYEFVLNFSKENNFQDNIHIIKDTSNNAVNYFKENNIKADILHIDGNHDYKAVKNDIDNYLPILKENGFLILDDIDWEPVYFYYNDLKKRYKLIKELIDENNGYAILKKQ